MRSITCDACGAKIRADRTTCPRCRRRFVRADPAVEARRSHILKRVSVFMLVVTLVGVAIAWSRSDWFTAQRPAAPSSSRASSSAGRTRPAPRSDSDRTFLDASGAGAIAYDSGDYKSALERFKEAVDRNPQDAEALSNLGQVLVRLGRPAEALPYFTRAIAQIPDRWVYRFNLARALGLLGRWDEAIAGYRDVQQLFPDDFVTTFNLGLALHKKGNDAAAVDEYKKAIALQPNDAAFRMALAISYERLQRPQDAASAYDEYLRLAPAAPDADKVRSRIAQLSASKTSG